MGGLNFTPLGVMTVVFEILMILFSLSVHESAHAWMADKLGDPTARMLGRITLNPIPHIDPVGTILLPAILALAGGPVFGWAKPVPVITRNFRHVRRDGALVAAAGPASNLIVSILCAIALCALLALHTGGIGTGVGGFDLQEYGASSWIYRLAVLNLALALFNFIPIPPLDGSWILSALLPYGAARFYDGMRRLGPILLLVFFFTPILGWILGPLLKLGELVVIWIPLNFVAGFF